MKILSLHLKRKWWEQIYRGVKTREYRLCTDYWAKRLEGQKYECIHLYLGYPKRGDASRLMVRKWNGCVKTQITHPEFGDDPVAVYAIDVTEKHK
jgi:hypothetical protein